MTVTVMSRALVTTRQWAKRALVATGDLGCTVGGKTLPVLFNQKQGPEGETCSPSNMDTFAIWGGHIGQGP